MRSIILYNARFAPTPFVDLQKPPYGFRARVLVLKLFIPRLSLLIMAETGGNCAVSAF